MADRPAFALLPKKRLYLYMAVENCKIGHLLLENFKKSIFRFTLGYSWGRQRSGGHAHGAGTADPVAQSTSAERYAVRPSYGFTDSFRVESVTPLYRKETRFHIAS